MQRIADFLERHSITYKLNESLSRHTSFRTGGAAAVFASPGSIEQLQKLMAFLRSEGIKHAVIGNGSNLLAPDTGYDGVVVCLGSDFADIDVRGSHISALAGASLTRIASIALENALSGMEFAFGIPGSLGGAVFMNAGAYDGEMKNVITSVKYLGLDGVIYEKPAHECLFGYRSSWFKHNRGNIVLSAQMALTAGSHAEIEEKMQRFSALRREKQPLELPSAGSTFKRPEGYFAAKLIEDAGLKGRRIGGAMVSDKHAGFIVNAGGATSADVIALMEVVEGEVFKTFGIRLEREIELLA